MTPPFTDEYYLAPDGLKLHARVYAADGDAEPVVCLPGLTRNARDFHALALYLCRRDPIRRKVVAIDYRGRGDSAYDPDWRNYHLATEAADVSAGLTALGIESAHFIGTSRGGLIVHLLAAIRPAAIRSAVLNDVGPVLEGEGLAHIRSYLERVTNPKTFDDALNIQRSIHGAAFPALAEADWRRFVSAIYREQDGVPVADFDPALLNQVKAFGAGKPLPTLWPQFERLAGVPLLVLRGENSKLLSASTLAEMARRHPDCRTITVAGQGHAPFLETGDLPRTIAEFFDLADAKAARRGTGPVQMDAVMPPST